MALVGGRGWATLKMLSSYSYFYSYSGFEAFE